MDEKYLIPGIIFILVLGIFYEFFDLSIGWSFFLSVIAFGVAFYFCK